MRNHDIVIALPTEDRQRAHAFARALGFDTPGELAEDGVPEPLRVVVNERATVMYIPTGGFGWVTAGRTTASGDMTEVLLNLNADETGEVDALVAKAGDSGGEVVSQPQQKPWGYVGAFADPDGHLWEVIVRPSE